MKKCFILVLLHLLFLNVLAVNRINYINPAPDSKMINVENNIIIGFEQPLNLTNKEIISAIRVRDEDGSVIRGTVITVSEGKKIIYKPAENFSPGKKISVTLTGSLGKFMDRSRGGKYTFSFYTSASKIPVNPLRSMETETGGLKRITGQEEFDYPLFTITVDNNPAPGHMFLSPISGTTYLMILDMNGEVTWSAPMNSNGGDFKKQPNGHLTYFNNNESLHKELDENYNLVNTYMCGNGYTADIHEFRLLNNGHSYLLAYDPEHVNMSGIVPGGNPNAIVTGLIIQELDENKNVVFQWRSWEHFLITDATHENLLDSLIDYVHGNAIEIDTDSNIILSSRHLDEITKINHVTGEIIWRMGGKNNQFTFVNDPIGFSHQHAIRRIDNGNFTLYDNGNYHTPAFSRAVEYNVDQVNKVATLIWEYRHTPSVFGSWGGYVQRLDNGNTLISWGGVRPTVTEVTYSKAITFEASFPAGVFTYRGYKYPWKEIVPVKEVSGTVPKAFGLGQNYPNPFNPKTTISFSITSPAETELNVYDISGKLVRNLVSGFRQAGEYSVDFDGSGFASGTYFYTLKTGAFSSVKKMILLK